MTHKKRIKRPFRVTLLACSVLLLTFFNAIRLGAALAKWDLILDFMPHPGPLYIALTGLFWTLSLLGVTLSIWLGWKWARLTTFVLIALYLIYNWLDRLVYRMAVPRENQGFVLIATLVFLFFTAFALFSPGSRFFFKQRE